ncbi:reverse transcriptase domain-containing protein [Tanacetum coccineum]
MKKVLLQIPQGVLPSNTLPNPREKIKAITTRSGNVLAGPSVPPPTPSSSEEEELERDPEMITDHVLTESTTKVLPPVVQPSPSSKTFEIPPPPTSFSSELPKRTPHQPQIPYTSRLNKEKLQDKSDIHVHKFFQMFKKLNFNISLAEALALMPKYHKMLKDLLFDKEKLLGFANTSLTENCSAVLLKKLLEKLGDLGKFLIPCDFPELEKCMALADLGTSINLMPLSVWKNLMIPELIPTRMTLELANRSIAYPAGIAKDVFVQVGRPFLRTARALVDVYGDEKLIFHADNTSKHPHKHGNESINMINFIDISCEDHFQEVLKIKKSNHPLSGSPSLSFNLVVESLFPSLTPFGDIHLLLEETDIFLFLDDSIPPDLPPKELKDDKPSTTKSLIEKPLGIDNEIYDSEGDILFLENLLNDDPIKDLPPYELNNDPEGDILFLENLLKDELLETKRSEIYTLIGEPSDTFLMGDEEIKFNPFKDIDDPVLIPRVSETPLDSFDSSLDSFDTTFINPLFELDSEYTLNYDNPIFDIQNEDSDASEIETIIDEEVFESHSLDSFKLGDENVVFDPGIIVIKGWIKHYSGGDIPVMDVLDLHFFPKDK